MISNESLAAAAFFIVSMLAAAWGYLRKPAPPQKTDPVLTGIGVELGNRVQMQELVEAVNRVADEIANKKQEEVVDKLDEALRRMDESERDRDRDRENRERDRRDYDRTHRGE